MLFLKWFSDLFLVLSVILVVQKVFFVPFVLFVVNPS